MSDRATRDAARSEPLGLEHLKELLRSGALSPEAVAVAAALGHPSALGLYPDAERIDWSPSDVEVRPKLVTLRRVAKIAGIAPLIRAAADWAERVLPIWESWAPDDPQPRQAIAAARRALEEPTPERRLEADGASELAEDAVEARDPVLTRGPELGPEARKTANRALDAGFAATWAAVAASEAVPFDVAESAETVSSHALRAVPRAAVADEEAWQRTRLATYLLQV